MSPSIIVSIEKRKLSKPWNRLAIIANCCQYPVRLDDTELAKKGQSLSLAILAFFLLNGEILHNGLNQKPSSGAQSTTEFLDTHAFNQFSPPERLRGLTYNKSCRFIDVRFEREGILTLGHLWKLGRAIDIFDFPAFSAPTSADPSYGSPLRRDKIDILRHLNRNINPRSELFNDLRAFIEFFGEFKTNLTFA